MKQVLERCCVIAVAVFVPILLATAQGELNHDEGGRNEARTNEVGSFYGTTARRRLLAEDEPPVEDRHDDHHHASTSSLQKDELATNKNDKEKENKEKETNSDLVGEIEGESRKANEDEKDHKRHLSRDEDAPATEVSLKENQNIN